MSRATPLARLLLLSLLVTAANAAEPTTLTFQRATVEKATYDAEVAFHADPLGNIDRALRSLMDKKACTIETLGTATIADGKFSVDTTREAHFFAPTAAGTYTLETADRRVGFRCSGRVSGGEPPYALSYELYFSRLMRRLPIGFEKNLAPDLDAGMPEMRSIALQSACMPEKDVPHPLGGGTDEDPATVTIIFVVLH